MDGQQLISLVFVAAAAGLLAWRAMVALRGLRRGRCGGCWRASSPKERCDMQSPAVHQIAIDRGASGPVKRGNCLK